MSKDKPKLKMNRIIKILMKRDGVTEDEARESCDYAAAEAREHLETGDLAAIEDILSDHFGLEPDYIFDLIGF
jgi:hypothetical protein